MKKSVLWVALILVTAPLWADVTKTATWVPPTQRVNGDTLSSVEIAGYDIECVREDTGEVVYATGVPGGTNTQHETPEVFDAGSFFCRMRTIDTGGLLSTWNSSNVFTVGRCDVTDCRPLPPSSIVIQLP